jgi:hypothetical protein
MNSTCPKLERCPIFIENITCNEMVGQTYRNLFCLADGLQFQTCKRYIASEKFGKRVPANIMPNTSLSIDEIGLRM